MPRSFYEAMRLGQDIFIEFSRKPGRGGKPVMAELKKPEETDHDQPRYLNVDSWT